MIALNYNLPDVLTMFRQTAGKVHPTADDIAAFDADVFRANNDLLVRLMNDPGLPVDQDTRSTVLLYSRFGDGELPDRIHDSCAYFKNTRGI